MKSIQARDLMESIRKREACLVTGFGQVFDFAWFELFKDEIVQVEKEINNQFGLDSDRMSLKFKEFMKRLEKNEQLYLTTQYKITEDIVSNLLQPPLNKIPEKIKLDLEGTKGLVLQQMNIWIGNGRNKSSGLHHDFHDNLYFVLKGSKKITMFKPEEYKNLYLSGKVTKLYKNGLFVYEEKIPIREDGAYFSDVAEWMMAKAEDLIENAQTEEETTIGEKMLDQAMEMSLKYSDEKDFENDDEPPKKRVKGDEDKTLPNSFSKIPPEVLRKSDSEIPSEFKLLKKAKSKIQVELKAGDCLYIPAGYFHEVISDCEPGDYHVALNYWYCPPSFPSKDKPYEDDYWKVTFQDVVSQELGK